MAFWNRLNNFDKYRGNDYSKIYIKNKNAYFYINREGSMDELIVFKPFLTELSYELKLTTEPISDNVTNANPSQVIKESDIGIKVALEVPATSVSEALANREKVSKLLSWLRDPKRKPVKVGKGTATNDNCAALLSEMENNGYKFDDGRVAHDFDESAVQSLKNNKPNKYKMAKICSAKRFKKNQRKKKNPKEGGDKPAAGSEESKNSTQTSYAGENMVFRISFANLIQSGKYDNEKQILSSEKTVTDKNLSNYALRCFLSNVNVDVDIDMGFFEVDGDMIPKSYKVSFDADMLNRFEPGVKLSKKTDGGPIKNILGFYNKSDNTSTNRYNSETNYHEHDSQYWPFGIVSRPDQGKFNRSIEQQYTNKSGNKIQFKKYKHKIDFYPFVSKLSVARKIDGKGMQEFKHLTGKDRIVFDTKMPSYSLGFKTSAINVAHSRQILYNYQKLMRMIYPTYIPGDTAFAFIFVRVGNLIGSGTSFFNGKGFVRCICNSLTIKPLLDFGFFEQNGMLLPKQFDISLTLEVNDHDFGA